MREIFTPQAHEMIVLITFIVYILFLSSIKMFIFGAEIHNMRVSIANREDPDQTVSSEAVWSGSALFVYAFLASN